MKRSVLTFTFILFSIIAISQDSDYSYAKSYEIVPPATITISSESRNIDVIANEGNTIQVFYSIRKDGGLLKLNKEQIKKGIDNLWNTTIVYTKSTLKMVVTEKKAVAGVNKNPEENIAIDLKILAPEQTSTRLDSSDGDILIKGLVLDQTCKANDGDITLIDLKGKVTAIALDGDIFLENVTGEVNSRTPDGRVINLSN